MSTRNGERNESEVVKAKELFASGRANRAEGDYGAAIRAFSEAVSALGDTYRSASVIDDTGMKLTLARDEAELGNLPVAAALYERVVESRLGLYEQLHAESAE